MAEVKNPYNINWKGDVQAQGKKLAKQAIAEGVSLDDPRLAGVKRVLLAYDWGNPYLTQLQSIQEKNVAKAEREAGYNELSGIANEQFNYGGLTPDQQALLESQQKKMALEKAEQERSILNKLAATGVGGGQAGRQLGDLSKNYLDTLQQNELAYKTTAANDAYNRFMNEKQYKYNTAGRKLGWSENDMQNIYNTAQQAQQNTWQQYMNNLNQQYQSQQAALDRNLQRELAKANQPSTLDYIIGGLGAAGNLARGFGGGA